MPVDFYKEVALKMNNGITAHRAVDTPCNDGPLRLVIVDDEELIRDAFCVLVSSFPEMVVVGKAANGEDAINLVGLTRPRIVLMDLMLPGMNGVAATRSIKERWPATLVIAVTALVEGPLLAAALELPMDGYILKRATSRELILAIDMAVAGRRYTCPEVVKVMIADSRHNSTHLKVTSREGQVLELLCGGLRNKAIADLLGISTKTVEKHQKNLRLKYKANTTAEMMVLHQRLIRQEGDA